MMAWVAIAFGFLMLFFSIVGLVGLLTRALKSKKE